MTRPWLKTGASLLAVAVTLAVARCNGVIGSSTDPSAAASPLPATSLPAGTASPGAEEDPFSWAWAVVAVVAAGALLLVAALWSGGFGDVDSRLALHPGWVAAAYAVLGVVAAISIFNALASRARDKALPFRAGIYLFPVCVIDAREHVLRLSLLVLGRAAAAPAAQWRPAAVHCLAALDPADRTVGSNHPVLGVVDALSGERLGDRPAQSRTRQVFR